MKNIRYVDLFCGIGGFRIAMQTAAEELGISSHCVFSCDIDIHCQKSYEENFHDKPYGDISNINEKDVPDHDVLLAGFPCQAFSVIGRRRGFEDTRGTLFFDIARILKAKKPFAFVLENVKLLARHDKGRALSVIMETLNDSGYFAEYKILNALDFGLPQKRERIFIVGFRDRVDYEWPRGGLPGKSLDDILEKNAPREFYASEYIRKKRFQKRSPTKETTIWHENKSGNVSAYPYSCALRAGASYNYLLVNGERRLTPREMLRLQGFPDSFKIASNYSQIRKQAGNSLPVPVAKSIIHNVILSCKGANEKVLLEAV